MRKLLFLCVTILLLSCSSDNDSNPINGNNIVGKWNLQDILSNGQSGIGGNYTCNKDFDITEYKSNGTIVTKLSNNDPNNCIQLTENGTYLIEGNIVTETQMNGSIKIYEYKYKIIELTDTTLKLDEMSYFESSPDGSNSESGTTPSGQSVKIYTKIGT